MKKSTILRKFLLWIVPSLIVLLMIMFATLSKQSENAMLKLNNDNLQRLTKAYSEQLQMQISSMIIELRQIADRDLVRTMDWDKCGDELTTIANKRSEVFTYLNIITKNGTVYSTLNGKETVNLRKNQTVREILDEHKSYSITDPRYSLITKAPVFIIRVPVFDNNENIVGALSGVIYLNQLSEIVSNIKIGESGFGFLLNKEGLIFAHPDSSYILRKNIKEIEGLTDFANVINNQTGVSFRKNPKGKDEYIFFEHLAEESGWILTIAITKDEITSKLDILTYLSLLFLLLTCVFGFVILYVLTKQIISKPLKKLIDYTSAIANGHLYYRQTVKSDNEIGQMADALSNMSAKLQDIVYNIRDNANVLATSSQQLNEAAEQIAQGANEHASSSEEISASMEEMAASITQNTENAKATENIAHEVAQGVNRITDSAKLSLDAVSQITEKISVISNIAEKTDMLAINAAVEAARAGSSGKGFTVVASEVRKLAEYTKNAADAIVELSANSYKTSKKASDFVEEIVPTIKTNAELVREIASTSTEQNVGANQINEAIVKFSEIIQQNAASSEELATSSNQMSAQAMQLKELVSFFKLDEKESNSVSKIFELIDKHNEEIDKLKQQLINSENQKEPNQNKIETFDKKEPNVNLDDDFEDFG